MRQVFLVTIGLGLFAPAAPAVSSEIGLPTRTFTQSWVALPTGRFTPTDREAPFKLREAGPKSLPDTVLGPLFDDAFASARDDAERRGIALSEMTTSWDQQKRTAFQRLRVAEAAYAGRDVARHDRFVATLTRVVDGTGRSAAVDGSASAALDGAYAAALARAGDARAATEAAQKSWGAYRDAFAAFADLQTPGGAAGVTAELERQRANDLAAPNR